jgi:hypothetical protein
VARWNVKNGRNIMMMWSYYDDAKLTGPPLCDASVEVCMMEQIRGGRRKRELNDKTDEYLEEGSLLLLAYNC